MPAPAPENTQVNPETDLDQPAPVREISQTDHINKKLLISLFNRINAGEDTILNKMLQPDNDRNEDDEWAS